MIWFATALGVANVSYFAANLMEWTGELGQFDYIIAHGFYSWVPAFVRAKLLEICAASLSPNGLAFISYNALPGCHFRHYVRDLLQFYTRKIGNPKEKVEKALDVVRSILAKPPNGLRETFIQDEFKQLLDKSPSVIYHDDLAEVNDAFSVTQFAGHLESAGLQLVCDADPVRDDVGQMAESADTWLERRQFADLTAARRFRESLVCRAGIALDREPSVERLGSLHVFTSAEAQLETKDGQIFKLPKGELKVSHPHVKSILNQVCEAAPASLPVATLEAWSHDPAMTVSIVERLQGSGAITAVYDAIPVTVSPGDKPKASPIALLQAQRGGAAFSSQRHVPVKLADPISLRLLAMLDGTKDRSTLHRELAAGGTLDDFNYNLAGIARLGLFIG